MQFSSAPQAILFLIPVTGFKALVLKQSSQVELIFVIILLQIIKFLMFLFFFHLKILL